MHSTSRRYSATSNCAEEDIHVSFFKLMWTGVVVDYCCRLRLSSHNCPNPPGKSDSAAVNINIFVAPKDLEFMLTSPKCHF